MRESPKEREREREREKERERDRVAGTFSHTGIDYFGQLSIKEYKKTRSLPSIIIRDLTFFTCLTTRSVHLKLAVTMSKDSFILALRSFVVRRSRPNTLR